MWKAIDKSFEKCWNKDIGRGGDVYAEFIVNFIYNSLVNKQILIEYPRIEKIVEIILDYIKMTGGFMDEPHSERTPTQGRPCVGVRSLCEGFLFRPRYAIRSNRQIVLLIPSMGAQSTICKKFFNGYNTPKFRPNTF